MLQIGARPGPFKGPRPGPDYAAGKPRPVTALWPVLPPRFWGAKTPEPPTRRRRVGRITF